MDVLYPQKPPQSSRLNPNAPIFIPMKSYQTVEDFSDQWWDLVHSSPFFRDYWLQDCFDENDHDDSFDRNDDFDLPDSDSCFDLFLHKQGEEKKEKKEVISMAALKWSESGGRTIEVPRYFEKAPKLVKNGVKVSPRTIHQPR